MLGLREPNALESKPIEAEPAEEGQRYLEQALARGSGGVFPIVSLLLEVFLYRGPLKEFYSFDFAHLYENPE